MVVTEMAKMNSPSNKIVEKLYYLQSDCNHNCLENDKVP